MGSHSVTCKGDYPDFTLTFIDIHFIIPRKVEGWVDLGSALRVHNWCPRLYISVVVVLNTRPWWASILRPHTGVKHLLSLDHCEIMEEWLICI